MTLKQEQIASIKDEADVLVMRATPCPKCLCGINKICAPQRRRKMVVHKERYKFYERLNTIPPITEPLGKHWDQPSTNDILVDHNCALMTQETFEKLANYSRSRPTGVYAGKMWRAEFTDGWALRWFTHDVWDDSCLTLTREIIIVT